MANQRSGVTSRGSRVEHYVLAILLALLATTISWLFPSFSRREAKTQPVNPIVFAHRGLPFTWMVTVHRTGSAAPWEIQDPGFHPVGFVRDVLTWSLVGLTCFALRDRRRRRKQGRRRKGGLCGRCGHDLRGNVSGRCPECGMPFHDEASNTPAPGLDGVAGSTRRH
jgi:hypothetical protein